MAQLALQYVFAALLALLFTQAVVPSVCVRTTIEIVCRSEEEQQIALETRRIPADKPIPNQFLPTCRGLDPSRSPPFCSNDPLPKHPSSRSDYQS